MENPAIVENLDQPNSLFKVFYCQNIGKPYNSGKILADRGIHYMLQGFTVVYLRAISFIPVFTHLKTKDLHICKNIPTAQWVL